MTTGRSVGCVALLAVALCAAAPESAQAAETEAQTIFSSEGVRLSTVLDVTPSRIPTQPLGPVVTIDLWCCGADPTFWSLNSSFYWATAFDTNGIGTTYTVTEVLYFAGGGQTEDYWIANDDGFGFPDPTTAILLGSQSVPPSGPMWQSFDASAAGATVEPGQVYWFIRAALDQQGMSWQSTTNPAPPVVDPVAITQNFNGPWSKWVTNLGWHMEYEIRGEEFIIPVELESFEIEK